MELKTTDLRIVMLTTWAKKSAKSIAIVVFALIFCIIVFAVRLKYSTALYPVLMSAGDALTSIGLAYIFWSLVLYAISRGGLDGVFYITHNIARTFKRRKDCKMCIRDRLRMSAFTLNLLFWPQIPLLMSRKTSRLWRNKSLVFLCRAS